jgi:uncharacterized protein (TIGR03086 family)
MPGEVAGVVATEELVVHAWDLARATGQDDRLDPAGIAAALVFLEPNDAMIRVPGGMGPKLDPPPDADQQTTLLAFVGRRS